MKDFKNIKIGFIGSMNAMPMTYASRFKEEGFDVKYIVESPRNDLLMRPENHFKSISYPYPDWIKEIPFNGSTIGLLFNRYFSRELYNEMKDRDVIFFNHYGHHVSSYFSEDIIKIAIFSGSDLDVKCNYEHIPNVINENNNFISKYIRRKLLTSYIDRYRKGINSCDIVSYFPKGLNPMGDKLLKDVMGDKPFIEIRKYDINTRELPTKYIGANKSKKMIIFSPVRFLINPLDVNILQYKGNDLIIKAVAKYYEHNKNIELHFVEKGPKKDIEFAKKLCKDLNIDHIVVWHKRMSLVELLSIYEKSDVIFDQVGTHWMGAIGMYGLYMGKPVITNARLDIFKSIWGNNIPILNATNIDEIVRHLKACEDYDFRKRVGEESSKFVKEKIDSENVYKQYKLAIYNVLLEKEKNKSKSSTIKAKLFG